MRRNTARIVAAGRPVSWLGANFWSRTGGPHMWRRYDPAVVREELRVLREHAPPEVVAAWAQIIRDAIRAAGGRQPLSLGDGAWGIEVTGRDNGFRLADTASICDFIGPHVYPVGDDRIRQHYAAAWHCELAGTFGTPVILEEFGVSSDFASGQNAARYYRHVLHNSLLAGATGWIAWNNTDFDLAGLEPYRHHAFEQRFGLTDAAGAPKPALAEMRDFAATLDAIEVSRCARTDADAALIVPAYLDTSHPFTDPGDRTRIAATLAQAYVSARLADLPVALARESGVIGGDARLYLAPSAKQLLAPTAAALERLAAAGACVYLSYSAGDTGSHPGPWYGRLNETFGVRHQLDVGLADPIEDDHVVFTLRRDFGGLASGTTLAFQAAGGRHSRAFLPVDPAGAEVIATDARGRPALLLRRAARGSLVLCTYPVEHMTALTPRVNPERRGRPLQRAGHPRRGAPRDHRRRPARRLRHAGPRRRHPVRRPGQPRRRAADRDARPRPWRPPRHAGRRAVPRTGHARPVRDKSF